MACAKIKRTKHMRNINDNAVQGRLSKYYRMKYFRHEIFVIYSSWLHIPLRWPPPIPFPLFDVETSI